jgi:hypothetical protein
MKSLKPAWCQIFYTRVDFSLIMVSLFHKVHIKVHVKVHIKTLLHSTGNLKLRILKAKYANLTKQL